jgi:glycosyltransferase involved in cell wall biosynthesis
LASKKRLSKTMPAPARLLDLTRLTSRLGQGQPTGVDRVEAAYLARLLTLDTPVFGLVQTKLGFLLLDRTGLLAMQRLVQHPETLPKPDLLSRLTRRQQQNLAKAETAIRALAIARRPAGRLADCLQRHIPAGFTYFNTGHANLGASTLRAVQAGGAAHRVVLIHDTIPLDHPEFTRPDTINSFKRKLAAVATNADLVIHSAHATRAQTEQHFARLGRVPAGLVAPLGIETLHPAAISPRGHPYFVALGTIEPRKNHGFLLDLWARMHRDLPVQAVPHLLILGRRGWSNEAVFRRLDALPPQGQTVFELPNLPDDQIATLLSHARALLFPSHVEGFGLPPLEAASLGTAVIVPPLPIYRETLGDYPVYASLDDSYSWMETILHMAGEKTWKKDAVQVPQWDAHFKTVLNFLD